MEQSKSTLRSPVLGPTVAMPIQFYVLCGNEPARTIVNVGSNLVELLMSLREDPRIIPAKVMWGKITMGMKEKETQTDK
ncbi:hypothetical protein JVT61DRAFT_523 [Boletus reticuloceps]|uniref:Uncharacterized protein n=1 Tax=Boletus reticuloceps TaxID=495285 RepID=A0A8I2YYS3_9AGAM|nr:hypothetical protein JVT61DRAFT_523 [Boletus reticuloceps]